MRLGGDRHERRKLLALSAAAILALAPLVRSVHYLIEPHELCPEHGEVVHGGGHRDAAAPTGAAETLLRSDSEETSGHPHGHCPVVTPARDPRAASVQSLQPRAELGGTGESSTTESGTLHVRSAVYRFAPKTSPPA